MLPSRGRKVRRLAERRRMSPAFARPCGRCRAAVGNAGYVETLSWRSKGLMPMRMAGCRLFRKRLRSRDLAPGEDGGAIRPIPADDIKLVSPDIEDWAGIRGRVLGARNGQAV